MGHFTDEMLRLRQACDAAQEIRENLVRELNHFKADLTDRVNQMRTDLRTAHAHMAQQLRTEHDVYISNLTSHVASMRMDFQAAQRAMAKEFQDMTQQSRAAREEFVSGLKQTVSNVMGELNTDRSEARRIWLGLGATTCRKK